MRASKGVLPIAEVVGLILAVTGILWQLKLATGESYSLVYIYLFPVTLIAALYNGRLAVLGAALALLCADYFLQEPQYSFANENPLEYGDLFSRFWRSRRSNSSENWCSLAQKALRQDRATAGVFK